MICTCAWNHEQRRGSCLLKDSTVQDMSYSFNRGCERLSTAFKIRVSRVQDMYLQSKADGGPHFRNRLTAGDEWKCSLEEP